MIRRHDLHVAHIHALWRAQHEHDGLGDVVGLQALEALVEALPPFLAVLEQREMRAGFDPVTVAKRGGWKTPRHVFETYGHAIEDITITAGSYSNIIRLLMPIVITDDQMKEAMDVMEAAIATVAEKKEPVAQMA